MSATRSALALALVLAAASAASARASLDDDADVSAFVSGFLAAELRERKVPGAVFVLVRAGRPVFATGVGLAEVATQRPVDPDRTLFRVGSVSKLATAAAAMQLVERGEIALDDDVNAHLRRVRVPDAFGEPVRVRHLLTHTGGFDDRFIGMASSTEAGREPLLAHLARRLPARVAPPGATISYSNYGVALLGAVVEERTGRAFETVVEERILRPLRMTRSSFAPGPELRADLAQGYTLGAAPVPSPYDWLNVAPAGALAATGADMGRFVAAFLAGGASPGGRILARATVDEMLRRHFTHDARLPGVGLGFFERRQGDLTAFEHAGDVGGFGSLLVLVPSAHTGFFLSYNGSDFFLRERFLQAFLARYFPDAAPQPLPVPPEGAAERAATAAGWYRWNRTTRADLTKLLTFSLRVDAQDAGGLRLSVSGASLPPFDLTEVSPGEFARAEGDVRAVLHAGPDGRVDRLFLAAFGLPFAFDRLRFSEALPFQMAALGLGFLLALSAVLAWPIAAAVRRRRGRPPPEPLARAATAFGLAACGGWLGLGIGLAIVLGGLQFGALAREAPPGLPAALSLGVVGAFATFPFAGFALLALARGWWSVPFRIHFALVAVGAALVLRVAQDLRLVGFHY